MLTYILNCSDHFTLDSTIGRFIAFTKIIYFFANEVKLDINGSVSVYLTTQNN